MAWLDLNWCPAVASVIVPLGHLRKDVSTEVLGEADAQNLENNKMKALGDLYCLWAGIKKALGM